jgi:hypothetical protein
MSVFTATLVIVETGMQSRHPRAGEYYSVLKINELPRHEMTWRNLKTAISKGKKSIQKRLPTVWVPPL